MDPSENDVSSTFFKLRTPSKTIKSHQLHCLVPKYLGKIELHINGPIRKKCFPPLQWYILRFRDSSNPTKEPTTKEELPLQGQVPKWIQEPMEIGIIPSISIINPTFIQPHNILDHEKENIKVHKWRRVTIGQEMGDYMKLHENLKQLREDMMLLRWQEEGNKQ